MNPKEAKRLIERGKVWDLVRVITELPNEELANQAWEVYKARYEGAGVNPQTQPLAELLAAAREDIAEWAWNRLEQGRRLLYRWNIEDIAWKKITLEKVRRWVFTRIVNSNIKFDARVPIIDPAPLFSSVWPREYQEKAFERLTRSSRAKVSTCRAILEERRTTEEWKEKAWNCLSEELKNKDSWVYDSLGDWRLPEPYFSYFQGLKKQRMIKKNAQEYHTLLQNHLDSGLEALTFRECASLATAVIFLKLYGILSDEENAFIPRLEEVYKQKEKEHQAEMEAESKRQELLEQEKIARQQEEVQKQAEEKARQEEEEKRQTLFELWQEKIEQRIAQTVGVFNGVFATNIDPQAVLEGEISGEYAAIHFGGTEGPGMRLEPRTSLVQAQVLTTLLHPTTWLEIEIGKQEESWWMTYFSANFLDWHELGHCFRLLEFGEIDPGDTLALVTKEVAIDALAINLAENLYVHPDEGHWLDAEKRQEAIRYSHQIMAERLVNDLPELLKEEEADEEAVKLLGLRMLVEGKVLGNDLEIYSRLPISNNQEAASRFEEVFKNYLAFEINALEIDETRIERRFGIKNPASS